MAAHHLADLDVLDCYLSETQRDSGAAQLAAAAAPFASGTAHAAVDYVQAQTALTAGDAVTADARVTDALAADPAQEPSLVLAARFAEARGDAATAARRATPRWRAASIRTPTRWMSPSCGAVTSRC